MYPASDHQLPPQASVIILTYISACAQTIHPVHLEYVPTFFVQSSKINAADVRMAPMCHVKIIHLPTYFGRRQDGRDAGTRVSPLALTARSISIPSMREVTSEATVGPVEISRSGRGGNCRW